MDFLVTGGAGFIGSAVVRRLSQNGFSVRVLDNLSTGNISNLNECIERIEMLEGDICDKDVVRKAVDKVRYVLHLAALPSVIRSIEKPEESSMVNIEGTLNLLVAAKEARVERFVFSSSSSVYGNDPVLPRNEDVTPHPISPYAIQKFTSELYCKIFFELYGLKTFVLRYFNVCGADSDGIIGDSKKPSQLLMQNAVRGAMKIEKFAFTCPKVKTNDGTPIRDYVDVEDLVEAHFRAFKYIEIGGKSEIFNLGNGKGYSVKEIVNEVEKIFKIKMNPQKGTIRKGEYAKIFANSKKAKRILKWKPKKELGESIKSLEKWYANFPNGYKN